ncbi:MAG TPA: hypothetical protein VF646_19895 [Cytophagales bacterium]
MYTFLRILTLLLTGIAGLAATGSYAQPTVKPLVTHASCNGGSDGKIQLQVTGTPPFRYQWSTGATTPEVGELNVGSYTAKVTDARGQAASVTVQIKAGRNLSLSVEKGADRLRATAAGGQAPYAFILNNISNPQRITTTRNGEGAFSNLNPGRYALVVTDANGCSKIQGVTIGQ